MRFRYQTTSAGPSLCQTKKDPVTSCSAKGISVQTTPK